MKIGKKTFHLKPIFFQHNEGFFKHYEIFGTVRQKIGENFDTLFGLLGFYPKKRFFSTY